MSKAESRANRQPNTGMQRTALRAHKIGAFLKVGVSPSAVPIYQCAAADAQTVGPPYPSSYQRIKRVVQFLQRCLPLPNTPQEALVTSIDSSDRTADVTRWPIAAFLAQLKPFGSYASYCLAGAVWLWAKQSYATTRQNDVKRFYDSLVDVVVTTTNQRDGYPASSGQTTTHEAFATAIMEAIAKTATQLSPDEARAFLIALSAAWVTRLDADCIRSAYQANHNRPLFVAEDADLSREVLQWIFYDLCDIAAIDQP
jgi:hypothetical protein